MFYYYGRTRRALREGERMTDTPRTRAAQVSTLGKPWEVALSEYRKVSEDLERELAAMEYRCDMAEGEVMCLDAAVEWLRREIACVRREIAWLRSGGALALGKGVSVYGTYYDRDEVEEYFASSPPEDFLPNLTPRKT